MSLQGSTFNTTHVMDNEIIKANDFEFAFEQLIENVSKATQMLLESNQDFVINGKVLPDSGMNLKVSPIYGVCKSTGIPFGRTEETDETIGFSGSTNGRIDILEVKGDWETYDNQQRAFNDPDTDTQTYQYVDTKKLMKPIYQIKEGIEGSGVAPESSAGWVKLAEISIRAGATSILESDIHNITADVAGLDNDDWTTEKDATYNIGYISDVNARFRVQHNEDGTHADDCINQDSLDIGTGTKQINGNVLPVGGAVSIPTQTIASSDSILSVITKAASIITSLYNAYLLFDGAYKFNGELAISAIADPDTKVLTKPLKLIAAGDGTALLKIDNDTILSIDANGKLSTNGYTASSANHIVTKAVTDAISTALTNLTARVAILETAGDTTVYTNSVLSAGSDGRYNVDSGDIYAATTVNITLNGLQTIDGVTLTAGSYVLVKNQTDAKENGIYQVASGSNWSRVTVYNTPNKIKGKIFLVKNGTNNGKRMFYVPKVNFNQENPDGAGESFGYDDINFLEHFSSTRQVADRLIMRDSGGRAKVAAPVEEDDIARKAEITALYGNVVGTELGTAAVGICSTFARSDHVHPMPSCVVDKYNANQKIGIGYAGTGLTCAQLTHLAAFSSNLENNCVVIKDVSKETVQAWLGLGTAAYASTSDFRASTWFPKCVCMDCFTGSADRPVMISTVSDTITGWTNATLGPATCCKLTFNPATGLLRIPGGGIADVTSTTCKVTFNFGAAGLNAPTWVAAWNGYELRATARNDLCVGYAGCAYDHMNSCQYVGCGSVLCGSTCICRYCSSYYCLCVINCNVFLPIIVSWCHKVNGNTFSGGAFLAPGQNVSVGGLWNCCENYHTQKRINIWTFKTCN